MAEKPDCFEVRILQRRIKLCSSLSLLINSSNLESIEDLEDHVTAVEKVWKDLPFSLKARLNHAKHVRMFWEASESATLEDAEGIFKSLAIAIFPQVVAGPWTGNDFHNGSIISEVDMRVKESGFHDSFQVFSLVSGQPRQSVVTNCNQL